MQKTNKGLSPDGVARSAEELKHFNKGVARPEYRYYCERCTGAAFYSHDKDINNHTEMHSYCQTCLQPLALPLKESNFILL